MDNPPGERREFLSSGDAPSDDDTGRRLDALAQRLEGRIRKARDRSAGRSRPEGAEDRSEATDPTSNP
jgi:hypothetical protein